MTWHLLSKSAHYRSVCRTVRCRQATTVHVYMCVCVCGPEYIRPDAYWYNLQSAQHVSSILELGARRGRTGSGQGGISRAESQQAPASSDRGGADGRPRLAL